MKKKIMIKIAVIFICTFIAIFSLLIDSQSVLLTTNNDGFEINGTAVIFGLERDEVRKLLSPFSNYQKKFEADQYFNGKLTLTFFDNRLSSVFLDSSVKGKLNHQKWYWELSNK
jgi:hypothetical protein